MLRNIIIVNSLQQALLCDMAKTSTYPGEAVDNCNNVY